MAWQLTREPSPMTANVLIEQVRRTFEKPPDARKGGNHQRYTLQDAALSAAGRAPL